MSNLTEWIKYSLYPTLFESIDTAFPEHDFKQYARGWRSQTYMNGTAHRDRKDKTVITKQAPGLILENGGEIMSLVDYVMQRDNVDFIRAVKTLAEVVGLQLPKGDLNPDEYQRYTDQIKLFEDCNRYFIYCLENSSKADEVRNYLTKRGYSKNDVKAMELGYIPSQEKLFSHLVSKGHSQAFIDELVTIKIDTRIGSTHKLTIPYRSSGVIKGFKFRTIGNDNPKYLNSKGLDRLGGFFNLSGVKGNKDLVIVEGELDSLSATVRGIDNVVATGGSSINSQQIKDAIKRGAKRFTLCFDTEPGKEKDSEKRINQGIEVLLEEGINKVYIASLPSGGSKTDPDSFIKEKGIKAFEQIIDSAISYYEYRLHCTIDKYQEIIEQKEGLPSSKDIDSLLDEVVITGSKLEPIDKEQYLKLFTALQSIQELGVSEKSISLTVDRLTITKDREKQTEELKKLLLDVKNLQEKGEVNEALQLLESKVRDVKLKDKKTEFSKLLSPTSEHKIREEEANLPDSLNTGFQIDGNDLLLPGGAISVYAAATNHGKTVLLMNTVLNAAKRYPDRKFIFLTYEERETSILQYFLNTYINEPLNNSTYKDSNRRILKEYFKTGSTQYINGQIRDTFNRKKNEFFENYIETGRILVKYVDYNSEELDLAIRYLHKTEPNLGGIFIDYFQLLKLSNRKGSRQEELKDICMLLKDTSVSTGLPICLAAQFNREVTNLERLHPTNIGEAGDIERIVNTLVGLWNMDKKIVLKGITDAERAEINSKMSSRGISGDGTGTMYLEILKSRDLPTGSYDFLQYDGNTGKVKNKDNYF